MPPRSFYLEPLGTDYLAYARAFFPGEFDRAKEFIEKTGHPFIGNGTHLAAYLGISHSLIRQILHNKKYHYRIFPIPKRNGDYRIICTPKTYLKVVQWWILDNIIGHVNLDDSVHGFRKGRSYISNARQHLGCRHILNVDIEKFFPSISFTMVKEVFSSLGYSEEGADVLAKLTTLNGEAPTGAPTSPTLGNLVLAPFDLQVSELVKNLGMKYTRYADDLTFSSEHWIPKEFLNELSKLVEERGFNLNRDKTKFMGAGERMNVTGVVINDGVNLRREWRNWARGYIHRALKNPEKFKGHANIISGIYGSLKSIDANEEKELTKRALKAVKKLK